MSFIFSRENKREKEKEKKRRHVLLFGGVNNDNVPNRQYIFLFK
jgi:hypothetical protein